MKKSLLIIGLVLISCNIVFAQSPKKNKKQISFTEDTYTFSEVKLKQSPYTLTAGQLLQQSSKEFMIAAGCGIAGGAICGCSALIDQNEGKYAMLTIGGLSGLVAIYFGFKGVVSLGKAGKMLDSPQGYAFLSPAKEGVGIKLSF